MGGKTEIRAATGLGLHTWWVGQFRYFIEVAPEKDEAGSYGKEHQSSPEADVVKGLTHAHPLGHLLWKGWAQAESMKAAGTCCITDSGWERGVLRSAPALLSGSCPPRR